MLSLRFFAAIGTDSFTGPPALRHASSSGLSRCQHQQQHQQQQHQQQQHQRLRCIPSAKQSKRKSHRRNVFSPQREYQDRSSSSNSNSNSSNSSNSNSSSSTHQQRQQQQNTSSCSSKKTSKRYRHPEVSVQLPSALSSLPAHKQKVGAAAAAAADEVYVQLFHAEPPLSVVRPKAKPREGLREAGGP
ncbi:hypothetical protein Emed_004542 [Eimeria media]